MGIERWSASDRLGILKPGVDAHTLGIASVSELLSDCGCEVVTAPEEVCRSCDSPERDPGSAIIESWIRENRITRLALSYRLNPQDAVDFFTRLVRFLHARSLLGRLGGPLRAVYFAGLPPSCSLVREAVPQVDALFDGEETPSETLEKLGIGGAELPAGSEKAFSYDKDRLSFGEELIRKGDYLLQAPPGPHSYPEFGTESDTVLARLAFARKAGLLPLTRAHMGPYLPDRLEAVRLFLEWTRALADSRHLDVLSIGTSQLSQSRFGEEWDSSPDGGGVPLNSPEEFAEVWRAARPMLVRTYAGTKNIPAMARMHERTIHNAWHALSLWWFCRIDNRGPHGLRENLGEHFETLRYIASRGTPFEPNVPHHFAFRGADDVTYVVSAFIAARAAKAVGIRSLIAQNMLNTPKYTWGVQDLAKSRAMLRLLRMLEDARFSVILETRAGLDYFSADPFKAKAQLAAVSALMDDIEPHDAASPSIVHVVSWSEGSRLADPAVIAESVQITRCALSRYRALRANGMIDDMGASPEVAEREEQLISDSMAVIRAIERSIPDPYTPDGLYRMFAAGFLPVPFLWECRDELKGAVGWRTRLVRGAVRIVDERGAPLPVEKRVERAAGNLRRVGASP